MTYQIDVLRTDRIARISYVQTFFYETDDPGENVLHMLQTVNGDSSYKDKDGKPLGTIGFECSCLQKRCGACAMRVNGEAKLACSARLSCYKKGKIRLEPLRKFPVVKDLIVDRSVMQNSLIRADIFRKEEITLAKETDFLAQEASRCLQCGCCLEVCPNYPDGKNFLGAAAMVPAARLLLEESPEAASDCSKSYRKFLYEGCGKSSACQDVCPAHLPLERLWAHANASAVWHRRSRHQRKYQE